MISQEEFYGRAKYFTPSPGSFTQVDLSRRLIISTGDRVNPPHFRLPHADSVDGAPLTQVRTVRPGWWFVLINVDTLSPFNRKVEVTQQDGTLLKALDGRTLTVVTCIGQSNQGTWHFDTKNLA